VARRLPPLGEVPPAAPGRAQIAAALLVVYVVWGSTYLGMLLAIRTIPVFLMASVRFLIAGALLYAWSSRREPGERPGLRQWLAAAVVGGLLFTIGNTGVAWAEQHVATGIASLVIATVPLWMALFDRVACGRRLGPLAVVGLAIGFGGAALLAWPTGSHHVDVAGMLVLVFAAAAWAAGSLRARRAAVPGRPLVGTSMQMFAGGAILLVVSLATGEPSQVGHVSASSVLAVAYLVVFGSILAFTSYAWLLRNTRTALVSTYAYVNPLVAVLLGWAVENETVSARTLGAGAIILLAVALLVTPTRARSAGKGLLRRPVALLR
jgi:drug/metabolite transporter (DMT)-like permease